MSYTVRRAQESDIPDILELLKQVNRVHYEGRPDLFKPETKYGAKELAAILRDEGTPVFVFEEEDGRVLGHGFCVLQRPENSRLFHDVFTLYIDDICVDEQARGRHVGEAIYRHILAFAESKGCKRVTLHVWSCHPGAIRFYEKMGLVPYKIGMEKLLKEPERSEG